MPRTKLGPVVEPTQHSRILDFNEIESIARAFVELGVRKVRLTGGEPLVRRDLPQLVERLARLAVPELCLTTNGSLLQDLALPLATAGLHRVTVSLDSIDEATFRRVTDTNTSVATVLRGIDAARRAGLNPVKINMVVKRGLNDSSIIPMAAWARREGLELRFIEYMDVGCSNGWRLADVVPARELRGLIHASWAIDPCESKTEHQTAEQFQYRDGQGQIGIIASITQPFCGGCSRARVSSQGELYPCLFASHGLDLAAPLRRGKDIRCLISTFWQQRQDRYSELRTRIPLRRNRLEMSAIGG
jgi:GTP 3',8-cyclase